MHNCVNFKLIDYEWATYLKNIVILEFDNEKLPIEKILSEYKNILDSDTEYVEILEEIPLFTPNDRLYSANKLHDDDVLFELHTDPVASTWRNYAVFQDGHPTHEVERDILARHFNGYHEYVGNNPNGWLLDLYYTGYNHAMHGNMGAWHHTEDYNNTNSAWKYATGAGVIGAISDPHSFWLDHPDLIDRWVTNTNWGHATNQFMYSPNHIYQTKYHGTSCAGAWAASFNPIPENTITNRSAIGVSPEVSLYGLQNALSYENQLTIYDTHVTDFLDFLQNEPQSMWPRVLSISYTFKSQFQRDTFREARDEMGMLIVFARGYGTNTVFNYGDLLGEDGFIVVGDYNPDYKVITKCDSLVDSYNYNSNYSAVDISAPGWEIWTTSHKPGAATYEEIEYTLGTGGNTSIAVPQVAGVASLVAEMYPWMTNSQIKQQILSGAHKLDELIQASNTFVPGRPDYFYGSGCLNAYRALFLHGYWNRDFVYTSGEDATLLMGVDFNVDNQTIEITDGEIRVLEGCTSTISNSVVSIGSNVSVVIESGANLIFDNCEILFDNNISFIHEGSERGSISIINPNNTISLFNKTISNIDLYVEGVSVILSNNDLVNCDVTLVSSPSTSIRESELDNSYVKIINGEFVNIQDTNITGTLEVSFQKEVEIYNLTVEGPSHGAILQNIEILNVYDSSFNNNERGGIHVQNCNAHLNLFSNVESKWNGESGIRAIHTILTLVNCNISENDHFGILANGLSRIRLESSDETSPYCKSSFVKNNGIHQLSQSDNIFDLLSGENEIASHNEYLMWSNINTPTLVDARGNFWGCRANDHFGTPILPDESKFHHSYFANDPYNLGYLLTPLYNPGTNTVYSLIDDELIFYTAIEAASEGTVEQAKTLFKNLIQDWPNSMYVEKAAKLLKALENDKSALLEYYANEPNLQFNNVVENTEYLEQHCNIELGNYDEAVTWLENRINSNISSADSLLAVIDLAYIQLLQANELPTKGEGRVSYKQIKKEHDYFIQVSTDNSDLMNIYFGHTNYEEPHDENESNVEPLKTSLGNNYPNPFNPTTTIQFSLAKDSNVKLSIYNIKGQKIKTMVSNKLTKGDHSVIWNGFNDKNQAVSSGVYFYSIETDDLTITKKMILMK